jgi:hypothetical protein
MIWRFLSYKWNWFTLLVLCMAVADILIHTFDGGC